MRKLITKVNTHKKAYKIFVFIRFLFHLPKPYFPGQETVNEIPQYYNVHPTQVNQWKKELLEKADQVFDVKRGPKKDAVSMNTDPLYAKIGKLNMQVDFLKKKIADRSLAERCQFVDATETLSIRQQCELLNVTRSVFYRHAKGAALSSDDIQLMKLLDECYTAHPYYGSRKMVVWLRNTFHQMVNRKRVRRLMRMMGLATIAPGPAAPRGLRAPIYPRGA